MILEVTFGLDELSLSLDVLLLLLFVTVNPHVAGVLLRLDDLLHVVDLLLQLLLGELILLGQAFKFDVHALQVPLFFNQLFVQFFDVRLPSDQRVLLNIQNLQQILVAGLLVSTVGLKLVPGFVHEMELVNDVIVVPPQVTVLLIQFLMGDRQSTVRQVQGIVGQLNLSQLLLQGHHFVLTLSLDFLKPNHVDFVSLELSGSAVERFHQPFHFLFKYCGKLLCLGKFKGEMLLLAQETLSGGCEDIYFELQLRVVFGSFLSLIAGLVEIVSQPLNTLLQVLGLSVLNAELTLNGVDFFCVLSHLALVLGLVGLQLSNFVISVSQFFNVNLVVLLLNCQVVQDSSVSAVQVTVLSVHLVQFRLEFKSQSHFLLVILVVLIEVFLELHPLLALVQALSF